MDSDDTLDEPPAPPVYLTPWQLILQYRHELFIGGFAGLLSMGLVTGIVVAVVFAVPGEIILRPLFIYPLLSLPIVVPLTVGGLMMRSADRRGFAIGMCAPVVLVGGGLLAAVLSSG